MTKSSKAALPPEKTIAGFEHEIMAQTPQQGIMDAVSLGVWGIAEQSGQLAGEWKRHRNLGQDLDIAKVTLALGELLAAITQTARAVGVSLEAVMDQQIARARTPALMSARARKTPSVMPPTSTTLPPAPPPSNIRALKPSPPLSAKDRPTPVKRQSGRLPLTPSATEAPALFPPERLPLAVAPPAVQKKRGRPRTSPEPAVVSLPIAAPVAKRQRKTPAPPAVIPAMQAEPVPPEEPTMPLATTIRRRRLGAGK